MKKIYLAQINMHDDVSFKKTCDATLKNVGTNIAHTICASVYSGIFGDNRNCVLEVNDDLHRS